MIASPVAGMGQTPNSSSRSFTVEHVAEQGFAACLAIVGAAIIGLLSYPFVDRWLQPEAYRFLAFKTAAPDDAAADGSLAYVLLFGVLVFILGAQLSLLGWRRTRLLVVTAAAGVLYLMGESFSPFTPDTCAHRRRR